MCVFLNQYRIKHVLYCLWCVDTFADIIIYVTHSTITAISAAPYDAILNTLSGKRFKTRAHNFCVQMRESRASFEIRDYLTTRVKQPQTPGFIYKIYKTIIPAGESSRDISAYLLESLRYRALAMRLLACRIQRCSIVIIYIYRVSHQ